MIALLAAAQLATAEPVDLPYELHGGMIIRDERGCIAFELSPFAYADGSWAALKDAKMRLRPSTDPARGSPIASQLTIAASEPAFKFRRYILEIDRTRFRLESDPSGQQLLAPADSRAVFLVWKAKDIFLKTGRSELEVRLENFELIPSNLSLMCGLGLIRDCGCVTDGN
ncbi:MAG: hypothetical protein AAF439_08910 [Pseudomonadota bacterium]